MQPSDEGGQVGGLPGAKSLFVAVDADGDPVAVGTLRPTQRNAPWPTPSTTRGPSPATPPCAI
ncbi:hypothetical protein [Streptomyces sp. KL116D]|uniref:hypothetical protein n=1 Tax=Streptomyces sp. KL116D TaxID=3045152 RepID=UPI0035576749